jgi:hypothetical protein
MITVYDENHMKLKNEFCLQNVELLSVKVGEMLS